MDPEFRMIAGRCLLWFERRPAYSPDQIWEALTRREHFNRWYPFPAAEIELRPGGKIRFETGPAATITDLEPNRVFAFNIPAGELLAGERDNSLRFEVRPGREDNLLRFTHIFDDRAAAASYAAGWQSCLAALEQVLAGEPASPVRPSSEQHEALVHAFGLDLGFSREIREGWLVSFERQFMGPTIPEVWEALNPAAGTPLSPGSPVPAGFLRPGLQPGPITAVDVPSLLEYDWLWQGRPRGRVRWEFSLGPGGARLKLTQSGPLVLAGEREAALAVWREKIENLAARLPAGNG